MENEIGTSEAGKINISAYEFDIGRFYCAASKSTKSVRHIL